MKKVTALLLALCLAATMLAACSSSSGDKKEDTKAAETTAAEKTEAAKNDETDAATEAPAPSGGDPFADLPDSVVMGGTIKGTPEMYPDVDLSSHETIYVTLVGDTPNDFPDIKDKINEYLEPFNTDVEFTIYGWSEYGDMYTLALTSGEKIDLIFTAPWCYLWTEANKGSFKSFDDEFLGKYMPLTKKYQLPESMAGVKLNGKYIALPQNTTNPNGKIVAIRQDLAEKYGINELKSWDDYMNYMLTIAEKETPESGILAIAAAGNNSEFWDVYQQQIGRMQAMKTGDYCSFTYTYDQKIPAFDEIELCWDTDLFRDFCKDMKTLMDAGAWSRSALTNSITDDDAFAALSGASIAWNGTVFNYMEMAEKTEGVRTMAYDITMDHFAPAEAYNNNDMAITSSSKNPERAAMVLDLFKNDTYLNHLFRLGIEGVHYTIDENGFYTELDKAADYPSDNVSICWAIKNGDIEQAGVEERKKAISDEQKAKMAACPTEGFVFDDSAVQFEKAAVDEVFMNYVPSLELGLFDDPDATIDQMLKEAEAAGLDALKQEFQKQYEAWYASMQ